MPRFTFIVHGTGEPTSSVIVNLADAKAAVDEAIRTCADMAKDPTILPDASKTLEIEVYDGPGEQVCVARFSISAPADRSGGVTK